MRPDEKRKNSILQLVYVAASSNAMRGFNVTPRKQRHKKTEQFSKWEELHLREALDKRLNAVISHETEIP